MLIKRTISAIVILTIALILVFSGGWIYTIGIVIILSCAVWEFINLFKAGGFNPSPYPALAGTAAVTITTFLDMPIITVLIFIICGFSIFLVAILTYDKREKTAAFDTTSQFTALFFITFLGLFLVKIRMLPDGLFWILISILPAGIGDIGAFLFGSLFGKHKLAPKLSPNKTVEGYLGGVFVAILTGYIVGLISNQFVPAITISSALVVACITGLLAPVGDLSKSIYKRQFNLKDTSCLIPGHGGMLDRIDTWLWAAPVAYFLIFFFFR